MNQRDFFERAVAEWAASIPEAILAEVDTTGTTTALAATMLGYFMDRLTNAQAIDKAALLSASLRPLWNKAPYSEAEKRALVVLRYAVWACFCDSMPDWPWSVDAPAVVVE